jgi:hypothetical protein
MINDKDCLYDVLLMIGSLCLCGAIILSDFVGFVVDFIESLD